MRFYSYDRSLDSREKDFLLIKMIRKQQQKELTTLVERTHSFMTRGLSFRMFCFAFATLLLFLRDI